MNAELKTTFLTHTFAALKKIFTPVIASFFSKTQHQHSRRYAFSTEAMIWILGSFCALNKKPFLADLLIRQFPPPYGNDSLILAMRAMGFRIRAREIAADKIDSFSFPCLVLMREKDEENPPSVLSIAQPA